MTPANHFDHLLVDGRNLLYRAAWANQMLSHHGQPTGGVFGFLRSVTSAWQDHGRPNVHVCWEGKRNWRFDRFPAYKGNRSAGPRDETGFDCGGAVAVQQPQLRTILGLAGVPQWRTPSGECDDVMHTLAEDLTADGETVAIFSHDRDMYQTTSNPLCSVLRTNKDDGDWVIVDRVVCERELGCPPEKVAALKALAGDSSDNIPGVFRVGPKIAAKMVAPFDTLQQVLDSARSGEGWPCTAKQRTAVADAAQDVQIYGEIVRLVICELELSQPHQRPEPVDLQAALEDLGILSLAEPEQIETLCALGGMGLVEEAC